MRKETKIYVAGHRGMAGSAILRRLTEEGYNSLVTRTHAELDLTDQKAVRGFLREERPEYVVLAAAKVGGILANNSFPADFIYRNIMIEANVIHESYKAGVNRLLFLGSSCIYPKTAPQPMNESALLTGVLEPTNEPYAIAKIAGIKMCESYNRQHGTKYRSVMPTNLYGPNDNYNLENSHVLPAMIRKFHLGKLAFGKDGEAIKKDEERHGPIPEDLKAALGVSGGFAKEPEIVLWGTGAPFREFLHVDDLASASLFVMELDDNVYESNTKEMLSHINVGTGKEVTIGELSEMIREIVGFRGKVRWDKSKPDGIKRKLLDVSLLEKLGWKPEISLKDGIKRTYGSYTP